MSNMRINATLGSGKTQLRALIDHPMESGLRTDSKGVSITANYIKHVTVTLGEKTLMATDWGPTLSKNPYLSFEFEGGKVGDEVTVEWTDNLDKTASRTVTIESMS